MYSFAAAAGVVAMAGASTAPAVLGAANALLRAAFAAAITLAASRARRWTWLMLAGVSALFVESGVWMVVTGAGLVIAFASVLRPRRRVYGAASAALAVQGLYHATGLDVGKAAPVVCAGAVLPVLVSAYKVSPSRVRRRVHLAALGAGGALGLAVLVWGAAAAIAAPKLSQGAAMAQDGLSLARDGKTDQASAKLGAAAAELEDANALIGGFWMKPALGIPGLAQQARALEVGTEQGLLLARQGALTAGKVDYDSLRYEKGRADLQRVRDVQEPLRQTAATLGDAEAALEEVRQSFLVAPVRAQVEELLDQITEARGDAQLAAMAAESAPGLLGGNGDRHYFVLFTTPAELRGIGGFMGDWAILRASNGKLELTESGRAEDLNKKLEGLNIEVREPVDYFLRYERWKVGNRVQDITVSPDFPTVAKVMSDVYPQAGGGKLDGALLVDPYALAAMLGITGPIEVEGFPEKLDKDNLADILLRRQYLEFPDDDVRRQFLQDALRAPFDELTDISLPAPTELGDALGPPVSQRRLMFWSFDEAEQKFLDRIGISGRYGAPGAVDFLGIASQNNANNKIDVYLQRAIEYDVTVDPATGQLDATVRVTLKNTAPAEGLPLSVIGSNDQGYALGTNAMYFSVYTPHGLRRAKVDGEELGVEYQKEAGRNVYSTRLVLDAGETSVFEVELFGRVPVGEPYRLDYIPHPTVNIDQLSVDVSPTPLWMVQKARATQDQPFGAELDGSRAVMSASPRAPVSLTASFRRR